MSGPVDVLAVMKGLRDLARHRLLMKRRGFDKMVAAGKEPNSLESIKADRAEYLVQQANEALAAVAELIEAAKEASATLGHAYHTTLTGQLAEYAHTDYQRLDAALARVQGGAE